MEEEEAIAMDVDNSTGKQPTGKARKNPVEKQSTTTDKDSNEKPANGDNDEAEAAPAGTTVSLFDYSVENHCRAIDTISELCREPELEIEQDDIQRLSSSITFIREWRQFCYKPQIVKFARKNDTPQLKDVCGGTELPQFSAAAVPKKEGPNGNNIVPGMSKDFIMYVGGSVWALDWCPRTHQTTECDIRSEFVAVAAHPPDSSYHKIGAPLTGRGVIQIWCVLNVGGQEEIVPAPVKKKYKKNLWRSDEINLEKDQPKKPRGRPRKKPIDESVDKLDGNNQALVVHLPEDPSILLLTDGNSMDTDEQPNPRNSEIVNVKLSEPKKPRGRPRKKPRNKSADSIDGNDESLQAVALQFPQDSSNSLHTDRISQEIPEQVTVASTGKNQDGATEGSSAEQQQSDRGTETINIRSSKPWKLRVRPIKKPINESLDNLDDNNHYVHALSVQGEESTKSLSKDGIPQGTCEQNVGNQNGTKGGVSGEQQPNHSRTKTIDDKSSQPHKPRGRLRKKTANKSADDLDGDNQFREALSVEDPEDSSKLLPQGGVSLDFNEKVADENTGRNQSGALYTTDANSSEAHGPRGRPRKKAINEMADNVEGNNQYVKALAGQSGPSSVDTVSLDTAVEVGKKEASRNCNVTVEGGSEELQQHPKGTAEIFVKCKRQKLKGRPNNKPLDESTHNPAVKLPENAAKILPTHEISSGTQEEMTKNDLSRKRKGPDQEDLVLTDSEPQRKKDRAEKKSHAHGTPLDLLTKNDETSLVNPGKSLNCGDEPVGSSENVANTGSLGIDPASPIPMDVTLPRVVLCLAHNGKVAWDVKWRPHDSYVKSKHSMGYLAVLLGNGALEVWDVPLPRATKVIYAACPKEGTDPRFVKLKPVFRCSSLKYGDRQSIPLTLEWSASSPHDLILAGCHDGVVALWKFSSSDPCKDTRPLLCFSADTVPIRALAWAPIGSDPESSNIIVTAGHKGLKFWDIRDPFRPLWDLNPVQRVIYSIDWFPDPRCIVISFDDGTLRILSMSKAANDVHVTGKPFVGTQQQGLHSYYCSPFALWSVQVSRLTGIVAYCSADGNVLRFQLTLRAVEKDPLRNRVPHFLCGSLAEEESVLTIVSPLLDDVPFPMKKSLNEWSNAPRTIRGFLAVSNQEKRAKEKTAKTKKSDTLALCYDDEPGSEFGPDDALMITSKSKQKPKAKSSSKKKAQESDQALVCRDSDQEDVPKEDEDSIKEENGSENEVEKLPPKIVAMHRVRWNMNKGSERWLCYGGAGGVVRCQEVNLSSD